MRLALCAALHPNDKHALHRASVPCFFGVCVCARAWASKTDLQIDYDEFVALLLLVLGTKAVRSETTQAVGYYDYSN
jgi:hypothetical protein